MTEPSAYVADPNVEAVRAKLAERSAVGIRKYGTTTAAAGLSLREWLTHLQQELMDASVYCEAELNRAGDRANQSDRDQVADLILNDPQSGAPCCVVSTLRTGPGGFQSFDVQSAPDATKWRVELRVSECGVAEG
jgi:hypothetical protein